MKHDSSSLMVQRHLSNWDLRIYHLAIYRAWRAMWHNRPFYDFHVLQPIVKFKASNQNPIGNAWRGPRPCILFCFCFFLILPKWEFFYSQHLRFSHIMRFCQRKHYHNWRTINFTVQLWATSHSSILVNKEKKLKAPSLTLIWVDITSNIQVCVKQSCTFCFWGTFNHFNINS